MCDSLWSPCPINTWLYNFVSASLTSQFLISTAFQVFVFLVETRPSYCHTNTWRAVLPKSTSRPRRVKYWIFCGTEEGLSWQNPVLHNKQVQWQALLVIQIPQGLYQQGVIMLRRPMWRDVVRYSWDKGGHVLLNKLLK